MPPAHATSRPRPLRGLRREPATFRPHRPNRPRSRGEPALVTRSVSCGSSRVRPSPTSSRSRTTSRWDETRLATWSSTTPRSLVATRASDAVTVRSRWRTFSRPTERSSTASGCSSRSNCSQRTASNSVAPSCATTVRVSRSPKCAGRPPRRSRACARSASIPTSSHVRHRLAEVVDAGGGVRGDVHAARGHDDRLRGPAVDQQSAERQLCGSPVGDRRLLCVPRRDAAAGRFPVGPRGAPTGVPDRPDRVHGRPQRCAGCPGPRSRSTCSAASRGSAPR